ncbi:LysE family translocator [Pseudomonas palmensis]|uniref:LysE family translocator n=1 Tax=Pseudomonas palmensis TaxID=2815362 RepID=UPI003CF737FD
MEQFLIIAAAHFLALLSPGPDFFLVARTSLATSWRVASGACLGIALANGVFIVAAFTGVSVLQPHSTLFIVLQLAGCAYLLYLGWLFIRHAGASTLEVAPQGAPAPSPAATTWLGAAGMGVVSGILNPKNALFYASLAAMLSGPQASPGWKLAYGLWMFGVVLAWDLLVAVVIGNRHVRRRFARALPWLERATGAMLVMLALGVIAVMALG